MALTDTKVRKALSGGKDYKLADDKGLFLLVRKNGGKLWRMKYPFDRKEKLLSFGPYDDVSLARVRDLRDEARRLLRARIDPAAERKRLAEEAGSRHTFESVAREWHTLQGPRWTPIHRDDVIQSLERDVFPALGAKPLNAIDAPTLLAHRRKIEARGAIDRAHRLRQRIDAVYVYALSRGSPRPTRP